MDRPHHGTEPKAQLIGLRQTIRQAFSHLVSMGYDLGTLCYETCNLGDPIQTLAQLGLLPECHVQAKRDHLHEFVSARRTVLLMDGWFSHLPENWPPSKHVEPLFVSFHIAPQHAQLAADRHFDYFKRVEPIGCRDLHTVRLFENLGIQALFSGCLTLSLQNAMPARTKSVYLVDTHLAPPDASGYPPCYPEALAKLVPKRILDEAEYIEHDAPRQYRNDHVYKLNRARDLIDAYSRARLVITSRLHCALSCLALGTPVVFLNRTVKSDPRFDGYRDCLQGYEISDHRIDFDWDNPEPKDVTRLKLLLYRSLHGQLELLLRRTTSQDPPG